MAESIIAEVETDFNIWVENRTFAPTIKALKVKLAEIKSSEINFQRKKITDFNEEQAEIISNRLIQKITTHFANHLKDDAFSTSESVELIHKVFQISATES